MQLGVSTVQYIRSIAVVTALFIGMSLCMVNAAIAASGGMNYDIPLSELSRVKKESPSKRVKSEPKKKKTDDAGSQELLTDIAIPIEPAVQPNIQSVEPVIVTPRETATPIAPAAAAPLPEYIRIHHSPYSFVVAGKRTVIQAVINSEALIKSVNCRIPAGAAGTETLVKMEKVDGTQFTYSAGLPGMAQETPALRYTIIAVDSQGREAVSQEYTTPVTASPVVPGWQIERESEADPIKQEDGKKTRESFSGPALPRSEASKERAGFDDLRHMLLPPLPGTR